ncbi:MAG: hypothetical protein HGA72_05345 [Chlorobiaceae bacterium]|nr:hypothetical protein [Chlorobiaceae bacterium]
MDLADTVSPAFPAVFCKLLPCGSELLLSLTGNTVILGTCGSFFGDMARTGAAAKKITNTQTKPFAVLSDVPGLNLFSESEVIMLL